MDPEESRLNAILEPLVAGLGYELFGVERRRGRGTGLLRVYIDRAGGISVTDCERVSRQVSAALDVEDPIAGSYTLEVSSPGLDRPLFTRDHYQRFKGSTVRVHLRRMIEGRRKLTGRLDGTEGEDVVVTEAGATFRIPFAWIDRARLVPDPWMRG